MYCLISLLFFYSTTIAFYFEAFIIIINSFIYCIMKINCMRYLNLTVLFLYFLHVRWYKVCPMENFCETYKWIQHRTLVDNLMWGSIMWVATRNVFKFQFEHDELSLLKHLQWLSECDSEREIHSIYFGEHVLIG